MTMDRPPLWAQANLDAWLALLYDTPGFNASFAPYVALLPKPGELLLPATMDAGELAMLQGGPLVRTTPSGHMLRGIGLWSDAKTVLNMFILISNGTLFTLRKLLAAPRSLQPACCCTAQEATFRRTRRHMEQAYLADVANPATVTARHRLTLDQYVLAAATVGCCRCHQLTCCVMSLVKMSLRHSSHDGVLWRPN